MNEKNLIKIVSEITRELGICAKQILGGVDKCISDCDKCITMYLTKEEGTEAETEAKMVISPIAAKNMLTRKLYDFFVTWERTTLVVFYGGVEEFLSIEDEADIEDTIDFLCSLCNEFNEEAIIAVNEDFDGTEKTFYDCFGDICDIYAR